MTNAEWIRGMTDLELAQFLEMIIHERDLYMTTKLANQGFVVSLVEMPALSVTEHLKFLQSPFNGGK